MMKIFKYYIVRYNKIMSIYIEYNIKMNELYFFS